MQIRGIEVTEGRRALSSKRIVVMVHFDAAALALVQLILPGSVGVIAIMLEWHALTMTHIG
jgi:hypothetical protein